MSPIADAEPLPSAPRSVLIIDDVPANIQVLAEALAGEYQVRVAASGEEGLRVAREQRPDLILLDVMMPYLDGFEVCRQLKTDATTQHIPVIFITARDAVEDEEHGLELGAVDYIAKPFNLAIVRARVRNHLRLKHRADLLEDLAHLDGLTGIANRRRFDEAIETELRRCQRAQVPLAVMMIDIDHFKQYNDHYGHGMGDDCLTRVATALAEHLGRAADLVARYGGEEFAAVIPEADEAHAMLLAERLREAVRGLGIAHGALGEQACVTISVGLAVHLPDQPIDTAGLLAQADRNLYAAKHGGRDRVVA